MKYRLMIATFIYAYYGMCLFSFNAEAASAYSIHVPARLIPVTSGAWGHSWASESFFCFGLVAYAIPLWPLVRFVTWRANLGGLFALLTTLLTTGLFTFAACLSLELISPIVFLRGYPFASGGAFGVYSQQWLGATVGFIGQGFAITGAMASGFFLGYQALSRRQPPKAAALASPDHLTKQVTA